MLTKQIDITPRRTEPLRVKRCEQIGYEKQSFFIHNPVVIGSNPIPGPPVGPTPLPPAPQAK